MKAAILKEINTFPVIENIDIESKEGFKEVQILASALNHRDLWICKGQYAGIKLPIILGSDGCGLYNEDRVVLNPAWEWGAHQAFQSKAFKVLGLPDSGCFADIINVPLKYIYPCPKHLSDIEAAALPLAGLTAYRALFSRADAKPGDKIFITGIGGGVALFVLQFAVAIGMEVYVSSSDDEKIQKAIELGAKGGINYKADNWHKDLKKKCGGGFDVTIDGAGGAGFSSLVYLSNPGGRIVVYGGTRGDYNAVSPQMIFWKQLNIMGSTMGSDQDFEAMIDFVGRHKIKPVVDSIFNIDDISYAFERMDKGKQFGKIVLKH